MKMRLGLLALLFVSVLVWLTLQKKSAETATIDKQQFDVELQQTKELEKLRDQQLDQTLKEATEPKREADPK